MDIFRRLPLDIQNYLKEYIRCIPQINENVLNKMNTFHNIKLLLVSVLNCLPKYSFILESQLDTIDHNAVLSNHGMYDVLVEKYRNTSDPFIMECLLKHNKYCLSILFKDTQNCLSILQERGMSKYLFQNKHIDYIMNYHNICMDSLSKKDTRVFLQNRYSVRVKNMYFNTFNSKEFHTFLLKSSNCTEYVKKCMTKQVLDDNDIVYVSCNPNMIQILESTLCNYDSPSLLQKLDWENISKHCTQVSFVEKYIQYIQKSYLSENPNMIQYLGKNLHLISWDTLILNNPNISEILENEYIMFQSQFQLLLLTVTHYSNTTFEEILFLCKLFRNTPLVTICNMVLLQQHCSEKVMECDIDESLIFKSQESNIFEHLF